MTRPVPFLNRESELAQIKTCVQAWGTRQIRCLVGAGGIGKTRLMTHVVHHSHSQKYTDNRLIVADILDFDDHTLHIRQNVGGKIAQALGHSVSEPYHRALQDLRTMEMSGVSSEQLSQQWLAVEQTLVACFNSIASHRRTLLCLDTIEMLETAEVLEFLTRIIPELQNTLWLVAGRTADTVGRTWQTIMPDEDIHILELAPFLPIHSAAYLRHKQTQLDITLPSDMEQKLLLLAGGNPLLMNMAVEWHAKGNSFTWLKERNLAHLQGLAPEDLVDEQREFARQLVVHMTETGQVMDWLIMVMACVYPLDVEAIVKFLGVEAEEAVALFNEASEYVFVRTLHDGRISLHDEMRRMVNEYVWAEIDPDGNPRRRESRITAEYLEREIQVITRRIEQLAEAEKTASDQEALQLFTSREALEQELWSIKGQLLDHLLFVDVDTGAETFAELFDDATRAYRFHFRGILLGHMQHYADHLSPEQRYALRSRQAKYFFDEGEYQLTEHLVSEILERDDLTPEQQINMLIQRANASIRLGSIEKGIADFQQAVAVSEANHLTDLLIKSKNALGWAHRLIGELDMAISCYRDARALCLDQGTLGDDYGWILNNLTFVLSYRNHRSAVGFGESAIDFWRSIGNEIGLGAAYLVLGMVYYQCGLSQKALEALEQSLSVFEPLDLQGWIAQVFSWRGLIYREMGDLVQATSDLQDALDVGSRNIEAMTLCRLGEVHMAQENWEVAERYLLRSHEIAQTIPDFVAWITALSQIITIAAIHKQGERLEELHQSLQTFLSHVRTPDEHALSAAYIGLARLALHRQDQDSAITFLKEGIALGALAASYTRIDVFTHMSQVESDFAHLPDEWVRQMGTTLKEVFRAKEADNIAYGLVTPIMYHWANWKKENAQTS